MTKRLDETPANGPGQAAAAPARAGSRTGRLLAGGALALAVLALLVVFLTRDDTHTYRLVFENAGQLVNGDIVRIGGTGVGEVTGIELTDDRRAEVTVSVSDEFAPLHRGTTAMIRAQGLVGSANRHVDISPAPNYKPKLEDGALLEAEKTTSIVELDQLFNTLDSPTRKGLDDVVHGFADWYKGQESNANQAARYFPPALASGTKLFQEITRDSETFQEFLVEADKAMGTIAENKEDLTDWVDNTGTTLQAVASDTESLRQAVTELPPALRQGSDTFVALRPALDDLERFVVESEPAADAFPPFLRKLERLTANSVPTFKNLRLLFNGPGAGNDLYDTFRDLPPLDKLAKSSFPRARKSLADSTPVWGFIRPYVPDFVAWLRSFGGAMGTYDANGHYARTMPIFDAFNFVDDADGGHYTPKPPAERGRSPFLKLGNLKRCPGASTPTPADGSTPFVDSGELANPDCDPSQTVGAP